MGKDRRRQRLKKMGDRLQSRLSTAFMDIRRQVGTIPSVEIYSNILIHFTRRSIDNPDITSVSTTPVLTSVTLHMEQHVDLRNGDVVIIKTIDRDGGILDAFRATSGDPWVVNSRKRANVELRALGREDIISDVTPPPTITPSNKSEIIINFVDDDMIPIAEPVIYKTERGEVIDIEALTIHGWDFKNSIFQGVESGSDVVIFMPKNDSYSIYFVYEKIQTPVFMKQFSTGRFRMDNGTFSNGAHWYISIPITWINEWEFTSPTDRTVHVESRGTLRIVRGSRLLLTPQNYIVEVVDIASHENGFLIRVENAEPTEAEDNAYITNWYGIWG